jgi:cleavage and polyadenylation specificity factor subunit 1
LAPKPHQEDVENIADFVWRFCVNYRPLNQVTKPYSYPIAHCDAAIDNFGDASGPLFFCSVDDNTGYHQLPVRQQDQEKLAFAAPDLRKYCYTVMPFGPMNAPATYTAMKQVVKREADALFAQRFPGSTSSVGCKQIIDDSILWSISAIMLIHYLRCYREVHVKYRISFKGKKCTFFLVRFEWIGLDVCTDGNRPAQSKFALIREWKSPTHATGLSSFLGLVGFYSRFIPTFEQLCQPLRQLLRKFYRKPFPDGAWTAVHSSCFAALKSSIYVIHVWLGSTRSYQSSLKPTGLKPVCLTSSCSLLMMRHLWRLSKFFRLAAITPSTN